VRYVRIIHPHHPLVGQLVRVVQQARHSAYSERQWVIELANQTCASIPLSWAVPAQDSQEPRPFTMSEPSIDGLWADATSLLKLAKMVQYLTAYQSEEVLHHEMSLGPSYSVGNPQAQEDDRSLSGLEAVADQVSTRVDNNAGERIDQTPGIPRKRAEGGGA
jgi:hypothetical protein